MRLQLQLFTIFVFSTTTVSSQGLLSINATVGIGGTVAPSSGSSNTTAPPSNATVAPTTIASTIATHTNITVPAVPSSNVSNSSATVTTPAPLTTVTLHNLTLPVVTTVSSANNMTGSTPSLLTTVSSFNSTATTTRAPAVANSTGTTVTSTVSSVNSTATTTRSPTVSNSTVTSGTPLTTASSVNITTTRAPTVSNSTGTSGLSLTTASSINSTTTRAPIVSNSNGTTPKPSTKFPETCQSIDVLVQSGECYYALEGLDAEMGSSSLTDSSTISLLNGYCSTFSTCYPAIEKCADFDPDSISIIKGFCDFYQFVTSSGFLTCAQNMEGISTPCTDNATETILNFNATVPVKCAKLMAVKSCSYEEVDLWCNMAAYQNYEKFVNRHIQTWMCQT